MDSCQFCQMNSAGSHESTCPLSPKQEAPFHRFMEMVGDMSKKSLELESDESLIERYAMLMSSYLMTYDIIELSGDELETQRLLLVADFIRTSLDACIAQMAVIQETRSNGK